MLYPLSALNAPQAVEAGLWKKMEGQTSEMKKLKEDQDKSRQRHENTLLSAIVSEETLCGSVEVELCIMAPCYVANTQDVLTEHHRTAFMDEAEATPHPINGPQGRCCFSMKMT